MDITMVRGWLVMTAALVSGVPSSVIAQSPPAPVAAAVAVAAGSSAITDRAADGVKDKDRHVAQLTALRIPLHKRYVEQLDAIDRLKNQHATWRRDRALRDSLASSLETANQLSAVDREIKQANIELLSAQRAYLAAIDAELGTGTAPVRGSQLRFSRARLAQALEAAPRRIVMPDLEIDPLADPEELDQRAAELRASETELNRQLGRLDQQVAELDHLATLRRQHNRAGDLFTRDNDEPQRGAAHRTDVGSPTEEAGGGQQPTTIGAPQSPTLPIAPSFESAVPTILGDVIDASTIASFAAAERSSDPAQRAAAAHRARTAVAVRLDQVKKKRTEIEARSHQLRSLRQR